MSINYTGNATEKFTFRMSLYIILQGILVECNKSATPLEYMK